MNDNITKKLKYKKVNAFTSAVSKGNPAAYLELDGEILSPEEMLSIGKEHSGFVSEVVFCAPSDKADFKLTYYSSECEVDFCGHGTIATMYDIIASNSRLLAKPEISIETNRKGVLTVYNAIEKEKAIYITAPHAQQIQVDVTTEELAKHLGVDVSDFDITLPIDCIDAGLKTIIVPLSTLNKEISIYPDEPKLKEFCYSKNIDIILVFSMETKNSDCIAHTRVFAPKFGYLEDPATGSGNSAFANYLLKNHKWNGESITVEQGGDNIEFNPVKLRFDGENVLFGGAATTVIEGHYFL